MSFGTLEKDMQLTPAEFAKRVPNALKGYAWETTSTGYRAVDGSCTLEIDVEEQEPRRIALLTLPRCSVTLRFDGFSDEEQAAFLARFERIYQKGGG